MATRVKKMQSNFMADSCSDVYKDMLNVCYGSQILQTFVIVRSYHAAKHYIHKGLNFVENVEREQLLITMFML